MNIQVLLWQAASLHPHSLPARGARGFQTRVPMVAKPWQVGPWADCLGWARRGSQLGEAQIPQADKTARKHPARGGGRGQATRWQEKGGTGAQA